MDNQTSPEELEALKAFRELNTALKSLGADPAAHEKAVASYALSGRISGSAQEVQAVARGLVETGAKKHEVPAPDIAGRIAQLRKAGVI